MKDEIKDLRDDDAKPGSTAAGQTQSASDAAANTAPYQPPVGQAPTGYEVPRDGQGTANPSGSTPDERRNA